MNGAFIGNRGARMNCSSSADGSDASFLSNKKDENFSCGPPKKNSEMSSITSTGDRKNSNS
jgi:hypothetical protein